MIRVLVHELRLACIALQFFTRVPVPRWVGFDPAWLNASARHFPLVGMCVGVVATGVLALAAWVFPMPVAVLLAISATVWMTGAFHEDGLADTCDALGGNVSRERALEIMKDSRIGSYGAVGLLLVLGTKAAALATMPLAVALPAGWLAHTFSRWAPVLLIRLLPYAGDADRSKAKPLAQRVSGGSLMIASGWALLAVVCLAVWNPAWLLGLAAATVGTVLGTVACGRWFHRRLGGITGDTLGATQQITELLALLGWLAMLRWPLVAA